MQAPRVAITHHTNRAILTVAEGADTGAHVAVGADEVLIGGAPECDLVLADPLVSRRHLQVSWNGRWLRAVDLDSKNGSFYGDSRFQELELGPGSRLRLGATVLKVVPEEEELPAELADSSFFGSLVGASESMRKVFGLIERVADASVPVLISGETGVGKELVAEELHRRSSRRDRPFVVIDCGTVPDHLIESLLFGHVRGAFTGATTDHVGLFEEADGGTVFLDEIGELAASLQPTLLRVLDRGMIRPVGASGYRRVDVRLVAATHRDLRTEVAAGSFREDLYYRLSVVRVALPALRDRAEDIPLLVQHLLRRTGNPHVSVDEEVMERLRRHEWPGNVRELRNILDACTALMRGGRIDRDTLERAGLWKQLGGPPPPAPRDEPRERGGRRTPFAQAKAALVAEFERHYLRELVEEFPSLTAAARAASMDRKHLRGLLQRYGMTIGAGDR